MKTWFSSCSVMPMVNSPPGTRTISTESTGEMILAGKGGPSPNSRIDHSFWFVTLSALPMLAHYIQIERGESKTNLRLRREKIFENAKEIGEEPQAGLHFPSTGKEKSR
jgi:hypothetical protein